MRLEDYLVEAFTKEQKNELEDTLLNLLMDLKITRLMKRVKASKSDNLIVSKKELDDIFDILLKIREKIIKLPVERRK